MNQFPGEIQEILSIYKGNFVRIFNSLYPAKNSTGFTERNLSVNFAKAYESRNPDAITWYEFQFGEKNNLHYDAIIINPARKELLLIESKRFSNLFKKVHEVKDDIDRINQSVCAYIPDFSSRIDDFSDYTVYGVILADVWTETKNKTKVRDAFADGTFLETYLPDLYLERSSCFADGKYFVTSFSEITKYESIKNNYHLLTMIWLVRP